MKKTTNKDFAIVKLNGGLGNQMFQWALARMLEDQMDIEPYLDMSFFEKRYARPYGLNIFKLKPKFVESRVTKIKLAILWKLRKFLAWESFLGLTVYSEPHFHFDRKINKIKSNIFIEGFFQSELYFKCVEGKLREDFQFDVPMSDENVEIIKKIRETNSISLHIRRGDYVEKKKYQDTYATCSLDYYERGVEYIADRIEDRTSVPTLFIFSDDINWVKENLRLPYECVYVTNNTGDKSYEDMRLMSMCKHNVIANSSFSWWGAWLNSNKEKIVVAPMKWFNDDKIIQTDVIPHNWARLEN